MLETDPGESGNSDFLQQNFGLSWTLMLKHKISGGSNTWAGGNIFNKAKWKDIFLVLVGSRIPLVMVAFWSSTVKEAMGNNWVPDKQEKRRAPKYKTCIHSLENLT